MTFGSVRKPRDTANRSKPSQMSNLRRKIQLPNEVARRMTGLALPSSITLRAATQLESLPHPLAAR